MERASGSRTSASCHPCSAGAGTLGAAVTTRELERAGGRAPTGPGGTLAPGSTSGGAGDRDGDAGVKLSVDSAGEMSAGAGSVCARAGGSRLPGALSSPRSCRSSLGLSGRWGA